jgi:hypothetical protein
LPDQCHGDADGRTYARAQCDSASRGGVVGTARNVVLRHAAGVADRLILVMAMEVTYRC